MKEVKLIRIFKFNWLQWSWRQEFHYILCIWMGVMVMKEADSNCLIHYGAEYMYYLTSGLERRETHANLMLYVAVMHLEENRDEHCFEVFKAQSNNL